ncbi:MAG: HAD family phosphatase [Firmicutes bacterium]|jgi:Cof subfamily protein (haloacid dehalogenase superfamily)|nr:HAD family phosphatase [Bacillota bacterium]NBI62341.1 HAD family phosphatase [Clostridiales bacterium]
MDVKLIALDLDGTTLNSENELTENTKAALTEAARRGIQVVPVTGRCYSALPQELLNLDDGNCVHYAVTSNGAEIRKADTGEILYQNYIDPIGIGEIKKVLYKKDIMTEVYVKGNAHIEKCYYDKVQAGRISYRGRDYVLSTRVPVRGALNLLDVHNHKIEKVAVYFKPGSPQSRIKEEFEAIEHAHVTSSGRNNIELIAEGCSKAKTLEVLCEKLNLTMSQVMAMGDSKNDLEMLDAAGLSIAMGNAESEVKYRADHLTTSNDQDGVAEAINKYIVQ